ncbi:ribosomal protection-like ABC-F family protein [Pullulanibacillus camelliae]|nr:ABC-F type ribosomal protection protein [Pullulanibacillus camelliae]
MKELLKLVNVSLEIQNIQLFKAVNAHVQQGDIVGVIGKNGAGKSTLLQLINGDVAPTEGQIQWLQPDLGMVMVVQETMCHDVKGTHPSEVKLLEKWQVPLHDFTHLSGGEKLKARLAKGFSQEADILLLDEPTNHLDEASLSLLKQQIKHYKGTILLVSHDRYFLDEVATKIWSLEDKRLMEHKGNYSSYMKARRQKRLTQQRDYEKQQQKIEQIEGQLRTLTSWSSKAHTQSTKQEGTKEYYRAKAKRMDAQVKSKKRRLEKELEKTKIVPVEKEYTVQFSMKAKGKVGKRFLEVKRLSKTYGDRVVFKDVNFTIQHGEKIAVMGPNGSGKTTLLKIIMGQEAAEGEIWMSPAATVGYLTQEVFDLPLDQTPEQLFHRDSLVERGRVQNLMKHLGFIASQWTEPLETMSMGERVKCKLMAYILEEKDVLILDEPTNHLDLPSREQLEETLAQYDGTLIVVSHDRYFREKTTRERLVITQHQILKQINEGASQRDSQKEWLLALETERQEVLGKLSFMTSKDQAYAELDQRFKELTQQINALKH